jgi:hypothetical protein
MPGSSWASDVSVLPLRTFLLSRHEERGNKGIRQTCCVTPVGYCCARNWKWPTNESPMSADSVPGLCAPSASFAGSAEEWLPLSEWETGRVGAERARKGCGLMAEGTVDLRVDAASGGRGPRGVARGGGDLDADAASWQRGRVISG